MRVGVDIDGVLANFIEAYVRRTRAIAGRDLFPAGDPHIWSKSWLNPVDYGYTTEDVDRVWKSIEDDELFWEALFPYRDTSVALAYLLDRQQAGDDVYFITARPGKGAKGQSERWLSARVPSAVRMHPTVLLSSQKGLCARALELDVYIDDRWENVQDVNAMMGHKTKVFLMDRPWNRFTFRQVSALPGYDHTEFVDAVSAYGITRVSSVVGICG